MKLGELVAGLDATTPATGWESVRICDLTEDSRTVVPGSLFVARRGTKDDGRKFITDAVRAGAVAVLTDQPLTGHVGVPVIRVDDVATVSARIAERFYGNPTSQLGVVAVTGTNGKTTTTYLVWQLLNALGVRCGLIGTVIVDDGVGVGAASMTTPPAIETSRTLSLMVESGCRGAVLEASSHALDQRRLDGLRIGVGVFTNLTGDHLDYHGTMERYGAAKARLFDLLSPAGAAVVNADDPRAMEIAGGSRASCLRCTASGAAGADGAALVRAASMAGMDLRLRGPWGTFEASVPLIGGYNVMNVLQAVGAVFALGRQGHAGIPPMSGDQIAAALGRVSAPPGRLEPVLLEPKRRPTGAGKAGAGAGSGGTRVGARPTVFVDFAHTDDALRNVLGAVRGAMEGRGRLWVVFGCGGDKDRTKRPRMGLAAAELADHVVVTSDNPRSERPSDIVGEILAGVPPALKGKVEVQVERAPAIRAAIEKAAPGDVVVIAGKGHETDQVLTGEGGESVRNHFDDREVAAKVLTELGGKARAARVKV